MKHHVAQAFNISGRFSGVVDVMLVLSDFTCHIVASRVVDKIFFQEVLFPLKRAFSSSDLRKRMTSLWSPSTSAGQR